MHLLPFDQKMPLLGNYPKDILAKIRSHICTRIHIAQLLAIVGKNTNAYQQGIFEYSPTNKIL